MMRNGLPTFLRLWGQAQFCQAYGAARDRWARQIRRRPHPVAGRGGWRFARATAPADNRAAGVRQVWSGVTNNSVVQPGERPPTSSAPYQIAVPVVDQVDSPFPKSKLSLRGLLERPAAFSQSPVKLAARTRAGRRHQHVQSAKVL